MWQEIARLADHGMTVLLTAHCLEEAGRLAGQVVQVRAAEGEARDVGVRSGGLLILAVACVAISVVTFRSYQKNV